MCNLIHFCDPKSVKRYFETLQLHNFLIIFYTIKLKPDSNSFSIKNLSFCLLYSKIELRSNVFASNVLDAT